MKPESYVTAALTYLRRSQEADPPSWPIWDPRGPSPAPDPANDLRQAIDLLQVVQGPCVWREEFDGEFWRSDCGQDWCIESGSIEDNGIRFCHSCGKPVTAVPFVWPDQE